MNVSVAISGGGIIGNYISLRLKRNNIDSIIIENLIICLICLKELEL
jgi:2-polyprenyl-6-methoxyphenol hydroxylase-like FAD-dependent oxidoreductase